MTLNLFVIPGDVLHYEFFIVTTVIDENADEGQCNREVTMEEMDQRVWRRIRHN